MKDKIIHLSEDQLARSVADEGGTDRLAETHLSGCPECRERKARFEKELDRLAHLTDILTPPPRNPIMLPDEWEPHGKSVFRPLGRPVFAGGIAVLLLLVGVWWSVRPAISPQQRTARIVSEMEEDRKLMSEIRELEEYALPEIYLEVSGESYGYLDKEFVEFVAPLEKEDKSPPPSLVDAFCFSE